MIEKSEKEEGKHSKRKKIEGNRKIERKSKYQLEPFHTKAE